MSRTRRALFLLSAVICGFLVLLSGTDYSYHGCEVTARDPKSALEVLSVAPMSGPVLFYPYAALRKILLSLDPDIYRVQYSIDFTFPLRLKIRLSERTPQVVLKSKNQWYGMDRTGAVFALPGRLAGYPIVAVPDRPSASEIRKLQQALKVSTSLKFSSVRIDKNGGVTFLTKEGIIIRVPSLAGIDERFKVLSPLLQVIHEKKIKSAYIDLSSEEMPVFRVLSK